MVLDFIEKIKQAPKKPGVYLYKDSSGLVLYVGKAINLRTRLLFYLKNQNIPKIKSLFSKAVKLQTILVKSEVEALLLEINLIKKFRPEFNVIWKDNKRPIYIKIGSGNLVTVTLSRKIEEKNVSLFGPFPSSNKARSLYRWLRKIFKFCSENNPKKPCFYSHINLCFPCPGLIKISDAKTKKKLTSQYKRNIKLLKLFLSGRVKTLKTQLKNEMNKFSKLQNFEQAKEVHNKLNLLTYLLESNANLDSYLIAPELVNDIGKAGLKNLETLLGRKIFRIEGYDIANILGKFATGSMVVFENGVPVKDQYRKFKIRKLDSPDDIAMITQVLKRRLNHNQWRLPDLILVDGAKAQVSAFLKVLATNYSNIQVIGLSKRLEELVIPTKAGLRIYRLANDSPSLQLMQQVRDEAHRFAVSYRKKLQSKNLLQ